MLTLRRFVVRCPNLRVRLNTTSEPVKVEVPAPKKEKLWNRWFAFWKLLLNDYKVAIVETGQSMKDNPKKTFLWFAVIGGSTACCVMNPDETDYRDNLVTRMHEVIFIGKPIRNPACMEYLESIEWFYNCDEIKRINLGVCSVMMHTGKSKSSALYKDTCSYLQPSFTEMFDRILDIGFWNKWWVLEKMMVDCDINPDEWK